MRNKNLFFLLVFLFLFSVFSQELTITTYYPSPVGIYKELKSNKLGVGPNTDPATLTDGELEVEGKLTVGGNSLIDGNLSVEGNSIVKRNLIVRKSLAVSENLTVGGDLNITGKLKGLGCNDGDYLRYDAAKGEWVCADPPGNVKELFTGMIGCAPPGSCGECIAKSFNIPSDAKKIIIFIVLHACHRYSVIRDAKVIYQGEVVWGPRSASWGSPSHYFSDTLIIDGNGGGTLEFRESPCPGDKPGFWTIGVSYVY